MCIDSKDADDAAQVIGRLIETHSKQCGGGADDQRCARDPNLAQGRGEFARRFASQALTSRGSCGKRCCSHRVDSSLRDGFFAKPWKHFDLPASV